MATIEDWLEGNVKIVSRSRPNIFFQCPSCGTTKAKCSIHIKKGIGRCFRATCTLHSGFGFVKLITIVENCSFSSALETAKLYADEIEDSYKPRMSLYPRDYPKHALPFENLLQVAINEDCAEKMSLVKHGINYLINERHLTMEQVKSYNMGVGYQDFYVEDEGRNVKVPRYGMIVVPIYFNEELVSYTSRSIEIDGVRLNSIKHYHARSGEEYIPSGQVFFNFDNAIALARKTGILTIVEDVWSALKIGSAVGTVGSNISEDQIHLLVINWDGPIAICRDNDEGGWKASEQDMKKLSGYYQDVRNVVPSGIDPDDDIEETKNRIASSSPSNAFHNNLLSILKR